MSNSVPWNADTRAIPRLVRLAPKRREKTAEKERKRRRKRGAKVSKRFGVHVQRVSARSKCSMYACRKSSASPKLLLFPSGEDQRGYVQPDPLISIRNHENSATIGKYIITLDRPGNTSRWKRRRTRIYSLPRIGN